MCGSLVCHFLWGVELVRSRDCAVVTHGREYRLRAVSVSEMAESSTKDQNMEETAISPVNTDVVEVSKDDGEEKKLQSLLDFHLSDNQPSSSRIMLVSKLADSDEAVMEVILNDFKRLVKDFREEATGLGVVQDSVFVGVFECFPDGA